MASTGFIRHIEHARSTAVVRAAAPRAICVSVRASETAPSGLPKRKGLQTLGSPLRRVSGRRLFGNPDRRYPFPFECHRHVVAAPGADGSRQGVRPRCYVLNDPEHGRVVEEESVAWELAMS